MKGSQYDTIDDALDIGSVLKKEKTFKENQEKIAKLKAEHAREENKEKQEGVPQTEQKHALSAFVEQKASIKQIGIFLLLIILITAGVRMYVASMPITDQWAELVVSDGLKNQVTKMIYDQYPTLSESKKQELILTGTKDALRASQNQDAIEKLSELYKESYKDPEGVSYLYEVDPYYFYDIAQDKNAVLSFFAHNLLAFLERWVFSTVQFFIPKTTFVGAIFYLPLFLTIICSILVFFITREVWNDLAGFIAALFFATQPILLEFSIPGFVDTNMLNIFFILATGFVFMKIVEFVKDREKKKYFYATFLLLIFIILVVLFRYNWSTWYVSILLVAGALISALGLQGMSILYNWKEETKARKGVTIGVLGVLCIGGAFFLLTQGEVIANFYDKIVPVSVKKSLHLDYVDPYGQWPDAFALIKELQTTNIPDFINYLGGNIFVVISLPVFILFLYLIIKQQKIKWCYVAGAYVVFCILSFRAVRVLPYFIPFFAITVGIGLSIIFQYVLEKTNIFVQNEKKVLRQFSMIVAVLVIALPFAYPLIAQDMEKSKLIPIMDDAMYNSAIFIKEQSSETAKVSTWWDRGTFYKALTEREVHMHSQPHMPTTYWLATFYNTESEVQAKNILSMMNCDHAESPLFRILSLSNITNKEIIGIMKNTLAYETYNKQNQYLSKIMEYEKVNTIMEKISCANATAETYVIVIDDLMPRYSGVQYFAAWDYETEQPDPRYPYTDLTEGGCSRSQSGVYCTVDSAEFFLNFTSLDVQSNIALPKEVYLVNNNTVQYKDFTSQTESEMSLIVYQRAGYWKMLYIPKRVADSMYVNLMLLDGYDLEYFEKVFDEVHAETSWVKVYKVKWDAELNDKINKNLCDTEDLPC